ncbi:hypothetical protein HGRIS_000132 [Hohenbuehelia grisea]|uniref:Serine-threonine/tyrosine-protein kinase catalytic domain-containing protein n=1 Tax=Hohenbuehelia grisea TaxID=104357 RepID=A0ABR3JQX4_9AGAR
MPSSPRTNIKLANLQRIVKLLRDIGETPPLSPLKPICGVALAILESIQDIRRFKDDHEDLAERITVLVVALSEEMTKHNHLGASDPDLERRLGTLLNTLTDIKEYSQQQLKIKWFKAALRTQELKDKLQQCGKRLDEAKQLFNITSLIAIQKTLAAKQGVSAADFNHFIAETTARTTEVVSLTQESRVETSRGFDNVLEKLDTLLCHGEFQTFLHGQLDMKRTLATFAAGYVCRAELTNSERRTKVIVKVFSLDKEPQLDFRKEVKKMQKMTHPNLHRILGISPPQSTAPFVVLSEYAHNDVYDFLDTNLKKDKVTSFMITLKILQGIASGLEFLRCLSTLSKDEIEECAKVTNFVLTSEGQVVIGHNLVTTCWGGKEDYQKDRATSDSLGEWLKTIFYTLIVQFAYGSHRQDYANWDWVMARGDDGRKNNRHLRYLQTFACYLVPTIKETSDHFDTVLEALEGQWERQELTFPAIRKAVMRERGSAFVYRPKVAINACVGDVGYMDEQGTFRLLTNVTRRAEFQVKLRDLSGLTSNTSFSEGTPDGSGKLRSVLFYTPDNRPSHCRTDHDELQSISHKFFNTFSASVRRQSTSQCITDPRDAWRFLLDNAVQLCNDHADQYPNLKIEDLILVIGTQRDLRYMYLDRREESESSKPSQDLSKDLNIDFVEYETPSPDLPWGYWVVEDGSGIEFTDWRCKENILFVQLEDIDIPRM